jgi:hypothetical protein
MVVTALPGPGDIKALTLARDGKAFQICQASNFPLGGPQLQASMPRNSTDYFALSVRPVSPVQSVHNSFTLHTS